MSDNRRHSPSPSVRLQRADDTSDEPMSHQDQACHCSDKRRVPRSPSPHRSCPPSCKGQREKRWRVTARDASPSPNRWCATTTGLLLHDRDHQCPMCLEYQKHISLDIVLETSSIMDTHEGCLQCLACVCGWNARMSGLEDNLASMHREHDYWHKCAEEAEKASTFSQQQTSAALNVHPFGLSGGPNWGGPIQSTLGGTSHFTRGRERGNTRIVLWRMLFSIAIAIPRSYLLPS